VNKILITHRTLENGNSNLKRRSPERPDEPYTAGFDGSTWSLTSTNPDEDMVNSAKKKPAVKSSNNAKKLKKSSQPSGSTPHNTSTNNGPNFTGQNPFSPLANAMDADGAEVPGPHNQNGAPKTGSKTRVHVPPIVIRGQNLLTIVDLAKSLAITNYNFKLTSIGVQMFIQAKAEFHNFQKVLTDKKWEFFTFLPDDERQVKFVLYGLMDVSEDQLRQELEDNNLQPTSIKLMTSKRKRFDNECLFLLSFKKDEMNINELRKTHALFRIIVRWEKYRNKREGPVQCRQCQMFGHSSMNCHMVPKCIKCGENHQSKNCIYNVMTSPDQKPKIPEDKVKCSNCGGPHTANHIECPERARYLELMHKIRGKNTNTTASRARSRKTPAAADPEEFPPMQNNSNGRTPLHCEYSPYSLQSQRGNHHPPASPYTNKTNQGKNSSNARMYQNNANEELFSEKELMQIMRTLVVKLRSCRNRLDQLEVISELALKFIGHGP
jgi:hypothetical protein